MAIRGRTDDALWSVVLDAADAKALSRFYLELLGWQLRTDEPGWATIQPPDGRGYLAFQTNDSYRPPTWPATEEDQQMQVHLDLAVNDLNAAVEDAVALGARLSAYQPQDDVRVLFDPSGHPFCLWHNRESAAD